MASEEFAPCPICAENRRVINFVTCPKCSESCCRGCTKRYLLGLPDINPACMSCKTQWDFEFVAENTDDKFHNHIYRERRAKILVDRERSLLPSTQPYVAAIREKVKLQEEYAEVSKEIDMYRYLLNQAISRKSAIKDQLQNTPDGKRPETKESTPNYKFVGHCPQSDCKGYLNEHYVCGLCATKACRSCRLAKHIGDCDKNVVETVRMLARDTKSCPNCNVPIFKISGCAQIFCTSCHIAFDWDTGKIETGRIHNPHYYEFLRQNGGQAREPGDVRCGGQIDFMNLRNRLVRGGFDQRTIDWVLNSHRLSGHIRQVLLPEYRTQAVDENTNRDLRVKYLLGKLSDQEWISKIKAKEKKREKNSAINLALTMFVDTLDDLHANMIMCKANEVSPYLIQLKQLRSYTRQVLKKISSRFQNKVPDISKQWALRTVGKVADMGEYETNEPECEYEGVAILHLPDYD